jgi:lysyl-tRNA synthetase class 2
VTTPSIVPRKAVDYVEALEVGLPPTPCEDIGVDRLAMLFADVMSIREVILFPHLRPQR